MPRITLLLPALLYFSVSSFAQQFIGSGTSARPHVSYISQNPAFAAMASNGPEFMLGAGSLVAGTNAFRLNKKYIVGGFGPGAIEGKDYYKDLRHKTKFLWANADVLGPAATFKLNDASSLGIYTRMRQVVRGGHISNDAFQFIGNNNNILLDTPVNFKKAGFTTHTFTEFGFSYGRILKDDLYHILRAGITVKYLIGMAAGSVYTPDATIKKSGQDTITKLTGELHAVYSENIQPFQDNDATNDLNAWFNRNGRKSIGFDIGFQYEYHPNGDPNHESEYLYSIAASITDIGAIKYDADTGSAVYDFYINEKRPGKWFSYVADPYATNLDYFGRLQRDSLVKRKSEIKSFKVGLPTAFRINFDWNLRSHFYVQANVLLNMKGSKGDVYNPGYVNMFNLTPRYERKNFSIGLPITYIGYQTMTIGIVGNFGPVFFGSASCISSTINKEVRAMDVYAGLAIKFKKHEEFH